MTRKLLDGRPTAEAAQPQTLLSTKCPGKWVLVDMETGDAWNGATMRTASFEDLALAHRVILSMIVNRRTLVDIDGLVLSAPPENHDAIRAFMKLFGGQEWVSGPELNKAGYKNQAVGMPVMEALQVIFFAEPVNFDDKYNRPGARPE